MTHCILFKLDVLDYVIEKCPRKIVGINFLAISFKPRVFMRRVEGAQRDRMITAPSRDTAFRALCAKHGAGRLTRHGGAVRETRQVAGKGVHNL